MTDPRAAGSRRTLPHHPKVAVAATAATTTLTEPLTGQRIPAAVTAQLVSAAGTSRRSSRAAPVSWTVTHGRAHGASPAAQVRYLPRRPTGRRWRTSRWRRADRKSVV